MTALCYMEGGLILRHLAGSSCDGHRAAGAVFARTDAVGGGDRGHAVGDCDVSAGAAAVAACVERAVAADGQGLALKHMDAGVVLIETLHGVSRAIREFVRFQELIDLTIRYGRAGQPAVRSFRFNCWRP